MASNGVVWPEKVIQMKLNPKFNLTILSSSHLLRGSRDSRNESENDDITNVCFNLKNDTITRWPPPLWACDGISFS